MDLRRSPFAQKKNAQFLREKGEKKEEEEKSSPNRSSTKLSPISELGFVRFEAQSPILFLPLSFRCKIFRPGHLDSHRGSSLTLLGSKPRVKSHLFFYTIFKLFPSFSFTLFTYRFDLRISISGVT